MPKLKICKDLFDLLYPVGTYYETSNSSWTPSGAGWYGTWVQDTKGQTLVSKSDSGTFQTLNSNVGSETVTLTINQIPSHSHDLGYILGKLDKSQNLNWLMDVGQAGTTNTAREGNPVRNTGGNQAHNNIQPSKVCIRWHRTA